MANLTRWTPWRDLSSLRDEVNRIFDTTMPSGSYLNDTGALSAEWAPACDVYEDGEGITVKAELPEVDPKDIDVKIDNGVLMLSGERRLEKSEKKDNYTRQERFYGTFSRSFTLPPTVDTTRIGAETKNGVLKVYLPKKAEAKQKQISVKVN